MDQLSNILAYARDCDVHVLADLHTWLNHLAVKWHRSQLEFAGAAAAAAAVVRELLIQQKLSQVTFAYGQAPEKYPLSKGERRV
jgi:hypothetical protein